MKPRTKLEHEVFRYSKYTDPIGKDVKEWAFDICMYHKGFATKNKVICMDCGETFSTDLVNRKRAICPNCDTKLKIENSRKRTDFQTNYFAVAEVHQRFQLIRYFEIKSRHKKDYNADVSVYEILQEWIRDDGKLTRVGCLHTNFDSWGGDWSIRKPGRTYYSNWKYKIYPYRYHPSSTFKYEFRKHGISPDLKGIPFTEAVRIITSIPQAETLLKAKQFSLLNRMKDYPQNIFRRWPSIKICMLNRYKVKDSSIWLDYLDLLEYFNKDLRNAKYVCPKNLKKAHDYWMLKKQLRIAKQNEEARKKKALKDQKNFNKHIAKFKNISFSGDGISIVVLQSVDEFLLESEKLKHCLFTNEYYAKTDSLIMSARIGNEPVETIEICLKKFKVLQSRGLHNNPTDHHDTIVKLVKGNMDKVRTAIKGVKVKRLKKQDYVEAV